VRYETVISHQNKRVTVRVTNKAYSGTFELPEFLRAVRLAKCHDFNGVSFNTGTKPHEAEAYENNSMPITRNYLMRYAMAYGLPMKICNLGVPEGQTKDSPLATRLKELRLKEGWSQEECAFKIGVARSTYSLYEISKSVPDLGTLIKIADTYGVSLDYLSGRYDRHNESRPV